MTAKRIKRVGAGSLARRVVAEHTCHGQPRQRVTVAEQGVITSIGTERIYRGALRLFIRHLRTVHGIDLADCRRAHAVEYLELRARSVGQSQLDGDRQALSLCLAGQGVRDLPRIRSLIVTELEPRAYTAEQISTLINAAPAPLALAIELCVDAGLRAHELFELYEPAERRLSDRDWPAGMFAGRPVGRVYHVAGKGRLVRPVMASSELAVRLECSRLAKPERVTDREIHRTRRFALPAGKVLSEHFTRHSIAALGYSAGIHGLRHSFTQRRLIALQLAGYVERDARRILAAELGHFDIAQVETYLR